MFFIFSIEMTVIRKQFMDNLRYYLCVMYRISFLCAVYNQKRWFKALAWQFFQFSVFFLFFFKFFICLWLISSMLLYKSCSCSCWGKIKNIFLFYSNDMICDFYIQLSDFFPSKKPLKIFSPAIVNKIS